ncbi:MAG: Gx transporter family protein [Defluviitaleaceae bacterium]|nr:Gx transporter family protein [Defluviitaleaceae bacterium]
MYNKSEVEWNNKNLPKTKKTVLLALFFSMCVILSYLEHMLPPIPFFPPGAKLGLSNIFVMYSLIFIGKREAFMLAVLKGLFVFLIRGMTAGFLSLTGGLFSVLVMCFVLVLLKDKSTYVILSVFGAIFHNIGQFIAVSFIIGSFALMIYLPVLIIFGIFAGIATAAVLSFVIPAFVRILLQG